MGFQQINFEYTDAQEERIHAPELIESAYVDINSITDEIFKPNKYLVYGPKGAGKSALASKLVSLASKRWDFFCKVDDLEEFEFNLLKKTGGKTGDKIGGGVTVWKLLLYIRMFASFSDDQFLSKAGSRIQIFSSELRQYGFLDSTSLVEIMQETSRKGLYTKFSGTIAAIQAKLERVESLKVKDPAELVKAIELAFDDLPDFDSTHYLILDGLDYPLRNGRDNAPYLADLIAAVRQVNNKFATSNFKAKIIVLFRDEILDIIPDPNLTKRANDNGISLDWYDLEKSPFETYLLKVIEERAKLAGYDQSIKELWSIWFPKIVAGKDSVNFILDSTRYLPRDLISFFRNLQKINKEPPFTEQDVFQAMNSYSGWLVEELSDALVGLVDEDVRLGMEGMLSEIGPRFRTKEFQDVMDDYGLDSTKAEKVLQELFKTSWIGNVWKKFDSNRFAWKHRNKKAIFSPRKNSVVHNGLLKALNLR